MKNIFLLTVLYTLISSNAHSLEFGFLNLDESTNIISDSNTNLEWLQWDETVGLNTVGALDIYGDQGWRLASHGDMVNLFNYFDFGITFSESVGGQGFTSPFTPESSDHNDFIALFGDTFSAGGRTCFTCVEGTVQTGLPSFALYEGFSDTEGLVGLAGVGEDGQHFELGFLTEEPNAAFLDVSGDTEVDIFGVALVRDSANVTVTPLPPSLAFFLPGLAALLYLRKRNNR